MVIWLIGLSGAGKTTIGRRLYEMWKAKALNTVFVDGDEIRALFKTDASPGDYSIEGRRKNAERITELCAWLDRQDINVVCCILSLFPDMRKDNSRIFSQYFETYLRVPMEILEARDSKGLYADAAAGKIKNVVGVDIEFPVPEAPDLIVDNASDDADPERLAAEIYAAAGLSR